MYIAFSPYHAAAPARARLARAESAAAAAQDEATARAAELAAGRRARALERNAGRVVALLAARAAELPRYAKHTNLVSLSLLFRRFFARVEKQGRRTWPEEELDEFRGGRFIAARETAMVIST